ncbi:substrate-binding periplasmic protein [Oligoflexus tunisiensis]|uniref:substrate-binding periplasmic protein n=1 Tax=Oligoflexus tunisiensis TaxID=708132 RepID=UPI00114D38BA|nr:transporter substrate-binding domain-containing protein [Oligoflexus tunisiensis]
MKLLQLFVTSLLLGLLTSSTVVAAKSSRLVVAMVHWPPLKIIDEDGFGGIDVAILTEITKRTGIEFSYLKCPWARCLKMLEDGKVDVITSLAHSPKRAESVMFIEPPVWDGFDIFFYTLGSEIRSYADLKERSIGVVRGSAYFKRFDEDRSLKKVSVTEENQLIKMLLAGRIDVIPGIEGNLDYMIMKRCLSGKIKKSSFSGFDPNPYFIGLSKKSKFVSLAPQLSRVLHEMRKEKQFAAIEQKVLKKLSSTVKQGCCWMSFLQCPANGGLLGSYVPEPT